MTYRLASLALDTIYDQPVTTVPVPSELRQIPDAMFIEEGILRPSREFARLRGSRPTIALRLAEVAGGVRLTLPLVADRYSSMLWGRFDEDSDEDFSDVGLFRVVSVSVQGRPRAIAVFRRQSNHDKHRHRVVVDLTAEEIGPEGVVFVDFAGLDVPWAEPHVLADQIVGIGLPHVGVEPRTQQTVPPNLSGIRRRDDFEFVPPGSPFFAVNPGAAGDELELTLQAIAPTPDLSTRVRSRVGREFTRSLTVETMTLGGVIDTLHAVRCGSGRFRVVLPASDEPRLVRPSAVGAWRVEVTPRP